MHSQGVSLLMLLAAAHALSPTATVGVVAAVHRRVRSGCVTLYTGLTQDPLEFSRKHDILKIEKLLAEEGVATAVSFTSANLSCERCITNRRLRVLLDLSPLQISQPDLTAAAWLLAVESGSIHHIFQSPYIPINCLFLTVKHAGLKLSLTEVYHIAPGMVLQEITWGSWSEKQGLQRQSGDFYARRDLRGLVLKSATIHNPPTIVMTQKGTDIYVAGFFGDVWRVLEKTMNFNTHFIFPSDGIRGTRLPNGSYNGMLRMVMDGEVHVAVDAFGMNEDRSSVVDFGFPITTTKYCIFIHYPDNPTLTWGCFLAPFSSGLWLSILAFVLGVACSLTMLSYVGRNYGEFGDYGPWHYSLYNSLHYSWGLLCQQGHDASTQFLPCQLLHMSAYFTAVVLSAAYSATLVSFLTVNHHVLPYTNLRSLLESQRYTFHTLSLNSPSYFSNDTRQLMYLFATPLSDTPMTVLEALLRVCAAPHSLLIPLDAAQAASENLPCHIEPLPDETSQIVAQSFIIAKESPYNRFFNHVLLTLRSAGILQKHRLAAWPQRRDNVDKIWSAVTLIEVLPIFVILIVGIVTATVIMLIENIVWIKRKPFIPFTVMKIPFYQ